MGSRVEVNGTLYAVGEVETFASVFRKRTVVVKLGDGKGQEVS